MKSLFIAFAAVACTVAASGCTSGDLGTARSPIDPFGTEPATSGGEPAGGNTDTIAQLCATACAHIQAACPGAAGGTECASDCASSAPAGCEVQFRAFVQCLASAQITCPGDSSFDAPQCTASIDAVQRCLGGTSGTGTAGGTGAAGATGTSGAPRGV
jgi:hypothetical protein